MSQVRSGLYLSKEQSKRQPKQQAPKGCCCKRSQCIKNYCDCYQSMAICSIYCKCIGCRNTEERLAVATPPKKTALATKRERAAALSAKAAAAAAKAGINIHLKPAPGSAAFNGQQFGAGAQAPAAATPAQILQLPDLDLENIITLPPPNAATATATKKLPPAPVQGQSLFFTSQPLTPPKEVNVCKQPVNVALLECILVQAAEAEELGLNEVQVGKLILHEFARGLQAIIKVYDV
ncbi:protein lin-54 homolog [Drosophila hydei]|uniref:Protein lin-54 homolog n=1 Tax=Drosophila hydei TaxID=7224 RepID=A0A6J1LU47_DROHY|nr:protein lin-54 homolog [Drosophila hydei]